MQSSSPAPPPDVPTMAQGAALWSALAAAMDQRARLDAKIVELTGELVASGTIEQLEGLPLDTVLALTHRLPRADRAMLLTAADVLRSMPATMQLFSAQVLSWGLVRGIVAQARGLTLEQRAVLDERIAASHDRFTKLDPDDALDAVSVASQELRDRHSLERAEERAANGNFLYAQPGMFGRGVLHGELDNVSLATVVDRVDAEAPADDERTLGQRRADGLVNLAAHRCCTGDETCDCGRRSTEPAGDEAGPAASPPPAPTRCQGRRGAPLYSVVVDMADASVNAAGVIEVNAPGCLPTLTSRVVDALAADATVQVVLMDGGRPLAVTRKVEARDVPADIRTAVKVRDGGDRFPASRRPTGQVHLHHLDKEGAGHHPDMLASLHPTSHRRVHRHQWRVEVNPANAEITFIRGDRRWTTLPRRTRLRRPPPRRATRTHLLVASGDVATSASGGGCRRAENRSPAPTAQVRCLRRNAAAAGASASACSTSS